MTTPFLALPLSTSIPGESRKRRVLLIGASSQKRELRSEIMRKLGMEVDCAADIAEARCWWKADLYDLVLIDMEKGKGHRDRFCDDLRGATPSQQTLFSWASPSTLRNHRLRTENPKSIRTTATHGASHFPPMLIADLNTGESWKPRAVYLQRDPLPMLARKRSGIFLHRRGILKCDYRDAPSHRLWMTL